MVDLLMVDYLTDPALWSEQQAALLRRMAAGEAVNDLVDWENVAEEVADLAKRDKDQIYGQLVTLCLHLLRWQFQPYKRLRSWSSSVAGARDRIARLIEGSPSLAAYPGVILATAYPPGRRKAGIEAGLAGLPSECPWTIEQILDHGFWP